LEKLFIYFVLTVCSQYQIKLSKNSKPIEFFRQHLSDRKKSQDLEFDGIKKVVELMASSDDCFDHFWDRIERYLPDTFPKSSAERKKFLTNELFPMMIWSKIESIASEREAYDELYSREKDWRLQKKEITQIIDGAATEASIEELKDRLKRSTTCGDLFPDQWRKTPQSLAEFWKT
jgi:hypothetical protein